MAFSQLSENYVSEFYKLPWFVLFQLIIVKVQLTAFRYTSNINWLIGLFSVKEERQNISRSLQLSKELLQSIDDRVHEQERIQRLREIYEGFDPRATTQYKGRKFKVRHWMIHQNEIISDTYSAKSAKDSVELGFIQGFKV